MNTTDRRTRLKQRAEIWSRLIRDLDLHIAELVRDRNLGLGIAADIERELKALEEAP